MSLTDDQKANRMHTVLYDMLDGKKGTGGVPVPELTKRINELRVFDMTEDEFQRYHQAVYARVEQKRKSTS